MKFLILFAFLFIGCSQNAVQVTNAPVQNEPAEIENAVKEYFQREDAASKVLGVTLHKQTDTFYIVGADTELSNGKRTVQQAICRKFFTDGKSYWLAESFTPKKAEKLKNDQ